MQSSPRLAGVDMAQVWEHCLKAFKNYPCITTQLAALLLLGQNKESPTSKLGVLVHTGTPSPREAEAAGSQQVQSQPVWIT
jgi:hypothetical protein